MTKTKIIMFIFLKLVFFIIIYIYNNKIADIYFLNFSNYFNLHCTK